MNKPKRRSVARAVAVACSDLVRRLPGGSLVARLSYRFNLPSQYFKLITKLFIFTLHVRFELRYACLLCENFFLKFRIGFWFIIHNLIMYYATKPPNV